MSPRSVVAQLAEAGDQLDPSGDENADVRLGKLVLDVVRSDSALDTRIDQFVKDGTNEIQQTMTEAPGLTLTILDRDLSFLNGEHLGFRMDLSLDSVPFRLVGVELTEDFELILTFEHRVVAWLRQHDRPLKVSRGAMTRAEFAYKMVREVQAGPIRFVSPSVHVTQPLARVPKRTPQEKRDTLRNPGFASGVKLKVKGEKATAAQIAQMTRALGVASDLNAPPRAVLAMVCAAIGESGFLPIPNAQGSGYEGVFQANPANLARDDTEGQAHYFLLGGKGFQAGGAIALSRLHPDYSPGTIATKVEASGQPGAFYDRFRKEADAIIAAYQGGGETFGAGGAYYARFEFTRGQPGPNGVFQREDSWTCMQRLAREVRWRCFVAGRNSLFFCSDDDLMKSRPRYLIDPQTTGVQWVTFDVEVGGRTVLVRGVRQPRPSQAQVITHADRWAAPPGSVIELADYGPASGRWLVDSVRRSLFDPTATIQLRQPQKDLPEPRSQLVQRGGNGQAHGNVVVDPGANRPGVGLQQPLLDFLALVAGQWGHTIHVGFGTNHTRLVAGTNRQSDHWDGNAADLRIDPKGVAGATAFSSPAAGRQGDAIATAALVVLGVDPSKAHQLAISGALNFGPDSNYQWRGHRVQIGWRTAGHFDHVHVGVA